MTFFSSLQYQIYPFYYFCSWNLLSTIFPSSPSSSFYSVKKKQVSIFEIFTTPRSFLCLFCLSTCKERKNKIILIEMKTKKNLRNFNRFFLSHCIFLVFFLFNILYFVFFFFFFLLLPPTLQLNRSYVVLIMLINFILFLCPFRLLFIFKI